MASSLLVLLDDITAVLDDVATTTKVVAKKTACVLGTAAMFLVGGGILVHGMASLRYAIAHLAEGQAWAVAALLENGANALVGVIAGAPVLAGVMAVQKLRRK
jgi:uncharacterized protein